MEIFDWKCECGLDSSKLDYSTEFISSSDERQHCPEKCSEPKCECGKQLAPYLEQSEKFQANRNIDAVFDYVFQIWRKQDGTPILNEDVPTSWDFGCSKCSGPAKIQSCDAYFEYYTCLNCNHNFKVN